MRHFAKVERRKTMNIGFVSVWMERGAAYVTKTYMDILKEKHNVFVYGRGGEKYEKGMLPWTNYNVTWGYRMGGTRIIWEHFKKWLLRNKIELVFFNEQREIDVVIKLKKFFPEIKIGTYVDYYKEDSLHEFYLYDFLICNTRRHHEVFSNHPQAFYVKWGVDCELFRPIEKKRNNELVFFHSAGMSNRKGTDLLIRTFIKYRLYGRSKLIVHTQRDLDFLPANINDYNIEIINKTVTAPGLYYLGDVYVYPTYLDGLGLTIYEALACGLPVIATDYAPMNEIINDEVGKLVKVKKIYCRADGYYWPLTICDEEELAKAMMFYIDNFGMLKIFKEKARRYAEKELNIEDRKKQIIDIFENARIIKMNKRDIELLEKEIVARRVKIIKNAIFDLLPDALKLIIARFVKV